MLLKEFILPLIRIFILFLIVYAVIKNLKVILIIALIIFLFLLVQAYLGFNPIDLLIQNVR